MTETVPLPAIARSAYALASKQIKQSLDSLASEALGAMALAPELGWQVDFNAGVAVREVPDPEAAPDVAPPDVDEDTP